MSFKSSLRLFPVTSPVNLLETARLFRNPYRFRTSASFCSTTTFSSAFSSASLALLVSLVSYSAFVLLRLCYPSS